jgi:hypothetical protein
MYTSTIDSSTTRRNCIATWAFLVALGCALGGPRGPVLAADPPGSGDPTAAQAAPRPTTVQLVIDFGDGFQKRYTRLAWKSGMTVWDLLDAAAKHPRPLRIQHQGEKDTLLVLEIDGVAGGGPDDRHWIYRVNKNLAERSAGVVEVQAGDTVLWRLESYP